MILKYLKRFDETNDISQNFSGITLVICEVLRYFVDFCFCFWYFRKMTAKFQFLSNRFEISKFCTFWWQKLKKSIAQLPTQNRLKPKKWKKIIKDSLNNLFISIIGLWQPLGHPLALVQLGRDHVVLPVRRHPVTSILQL